MKNLKLKKTRLHVERDVLRILKTQELKHVDGGNTIVVAITGDSQNVCCA